MSHWLTGESDLLINICVAQCMNIDILNASPELNLFTYEIELEGVVKFNNTWIGRFGSNLLEIVLTLSWCRINIYFLLNPLKINRLEV